MIEPFVNIIKTDNYSPDTNNTALYFKTDRFYYYIHVRDSNPPEPFVQHIPIGENNDPDEFINHLEFKEVHYNNFNKTNAIGFGNEAAFDCCQLL